MKAEYSKVDGLSNHSQKVYDSHYYADNITALSYTLFNTIHILQAVNQSFYHP